MTENNKLIFTDFCKNLQKKDEIKNLLVINILGTILFSFLKKSNVFFLKKNKEKFFHKKLLLKKCPPSTNLNGLPVISNS